MKQKMKLGEKIVAIIIGLAIVLTTVNLPANTLKAKAETTAINKVELSYREIDFNIELTYEECIKRINNSEKGKIYDDFSIESVELRVGNGTRDWKTYEHPVEDETYYLIYNLVSLDGKAWPDDIHINVYPSILVTEIDNFTVWLNGEEREDAELRKHASIKNGFVIWIPIKACTSGIIDKVELVDEKFSMQMGTTHSFKANVTGSANDKSVTWEVSGQKHSQTKIDSETGVLTISANEVASELTVKAISKYDDSKYDEATVVVCDEEQTISKMIVERKPTTIADGRNDYFKFKLEGNQIDKRLMCKLEGNSSSETIAHTEAGYPEWVIVNVDLNESAEKLKLTVWPLHNESLAQTFEINVKKRQRISEFDITCLYEKLNATDGEGRYNINKRLKSNILSVKGKQIQAESFDEYEVCNIDENGKVTYSSTVDASNQSWIRIPVGTNDELYGDDSTYPVMPESIRDTEKPTRVSEFDGIVVRVNGVETTNAYFMKRSEGTTVCYLYIPLKVYTREAIITDMPMSLEKGGEFTFNTILYGNGLDDTVLWSVEGNTSTDTVVDANGKLTIGLDENATEIIVKASLKEGQPKPSTVSVKITAEKQDITSVSISSGSSKAFPQETLQYEALVLGNQIDKSVTWSVKGNASDNTTITQLGVLTIGEDETASSITVVATAKKNLAVYGEKVIEIATPTEVNKLELSLELSNFELVNTVVLEELEEQLLKCLTVKTPGIVVTRYNVETTADFGDIFYDGNEIYLKPDVDARIKYSFDFDNIYGYYWPTTLDNKDEEFSLSDVTGFDVLINGEKRNDILVERYGKYLSVYVPLGKVICKVEPEIVKTPSTCIKQGKESYYHCSVCGKDFADKNKTKEITDLSVLKSLPLGDHVYGEGVITKQPTVDEFGEIVYECLICNDKKTEPVDKLHVHKGTKVAGKAASCAVEGWKDYYKCECGIYFSDEACTKEITDLETWKLGAGKLAKKEHTLTTVKTPATLTTDGKIESKCSTCNKIIESKQIYAAKTIKLSKEKYSYDGKTKKPVVTVKDSKGNTIASSNYTVAYPTGMKKVGKYTVKITFKGDYTGTNNLTYVINPAKPKLSKVVAGSKSIKVDWIKQTKEVTGYEIQYSTSKNFKSGNKKVTVKSAKTPKTATTTISKLKANKKYYVRIRTYKKVGSKKYYSDWSAKKAVKTKK